MFFKLLKEPLIQFFLSGFVLYGIYTLMGNATSPVSNTGQQTKVIALASQLLKEYNKTLPLKESSLEKLLSYQEILLQESYFLELYKQDKEIEKILLHKMELMLNKKGIKDPSEELLHTFYTQHQQEYMEVHTYKLYLLDVTTLSKKEAKETAHRLNLLEIQPEKLPLVTISSQEMTQKYGAYFTHHLSQQFSHRWSIPVLSKEGSSYIVYITAKEGDKPLAFSDIETRVYKDYKWEKTLEAQREAFAKIKKYYKIEVR